MPLIGKLLKKGLQLRQSLEQHYGSPFDLQKTVLKHMLLTARDTQFGQHYRFNQLLTHHKDSRSDAFYEAYKAQVPIFDYNKLYNAWWHRLRDGEKNITWPGKVKYFALSSGTSEAASKYIPVTKDMLKAIQRVSVRQILTLSNYDLPESLYEKGILMLGGSTSLNKQDFYYEGDLSGITVSRMPYWFYRFYKPGRKIARERDWDRKLEEITLQAHKWDIGVIVGVPAWLQMLMEKIIDHYGLQTIHDIWPNLRIFIHGGVALTPYLKSFERLCAQPLTYIETYLASEGFLAFRTRPQASGMQLMLNNDIFFEFIPFTERNFTAEGNLVDEPQTLMIHEVEPEKEYALLLSTCAGAWRYLIGDVIKFTNLAENEIIITGRTKHFLSLCGEHLSVDNMNQAIQQLSTDLNVEINEFTVTGIHYQGLFAHHWYIGIDHPVDHEEVRTKLDNCLKALNDDYKVERGAALAEVIVTLVPNRLFIDWMNQQGKMGGQHKFPRVLKGKPLEDWTAYLQAQHISVNPISQ
uniref:GH3 auxin-responsive promoter family protein n=1 Tax=Roseihalotalea indica TaxID=2867963 RepID=A0AA49GKY3_9BACT|nr:GH3 auxin-responsive promoter family protein [Tunicatimonas sp. TK19036]